MGVGVGVGVGVGTRPVGLSQTAVNALNASALLAAVSKTSQPYIANYLASIGMDSRPDLAGVGAGAGAGAGAEARVSSAGASSSGGGSGDSSGSGSGSGSGSAEGLGLGQGGPSVAAGGPGSSQRDGPRTEAGAEEASLPSLGGAQWWLQDDGDD